MFENLIVCYFVCMSLWSVLFLLPLAHMVRNGYEHRWSKNKLRGRETGVQFRFTHWALQRMPLYTRYREEQKRFTTIRKVFKYLNGKKRLNLGRLVCLKKCVRSCGQSCGGTSKAKSYCFDAKPDVRYCCLNHLLRNEQIITSAKEQNCYPWYKPPSVRFKLSELVKEPLSSYKNSNKWFCNVAQAMKFYERIVGFEGRNYWGKTCTCCGKSRKNAKKFFKFITRQDSVKTTRFYCGDICLINGLLEVSKG